MTKDKDDVIVMAPPAMNGMPEGVTRIQYVSFGVKVVWELKIQTVEADAKIYSIPYWANPTIERF